MCKRPFKNVWCLTMCFNDVVQRANEQTSSADEDTNVLQIINIHRNVEDERILHGCNKNGTNASGIERESGRVEFRGGSGDARHAGGDSR